MAQGCRKTKKLICGMEGENAVALWPPAFPRSSHPLMVTLYVKCVNKNKYAENIQIHFAYDIYMQQTVVFSFK